MRNVSKYEFSCCNMLSWKFLFLLCARFINAVWFIRGNRPNSKAERTIQPRFLRLPRVMVRREGQTEEVTCSDVSISSHLCMVCAVIVEFSHITAVGRDVTLREILFSFRCFFSTLHGTVAFGRGVMEWPLQLFALIDFHSHCSSTLPECTNWSVTIQCWRAFHFQS